MNFPVWGLSVESGNGAMCRSRTSGVRGAEQSGEERISTRPLATTARRRIDESCNESSPAPAICLSPRHAPNGNRLACSGCVEASTRDRSRKKVLRNSPNRAYDDFLPLQARLQAFSSLSILSWFVCLEYLLSVTEGIDAWNLLKKE